MTARESVAVDARPIDPEVAVDTIDRFVVPRGHAEAAAFVVRQLYVAHGLRERLAWPLHRALGGRALRRQARASDLTVASRTVLADLGDAGVAAGPRTPRSWIIDTDYADSARGRSVVFLFADRPGVPSAVVKHAAAPAAGAAGSLAREREALDALRKALPGELAGTVPRVLSYSVAGGWESLTLEWLAGRSAYADMQTGLVPVLAVAGHFDAAARWLAGLHEATVEPAAAVRPSLPAPLLDRPGGAAPPDWFARLCDACDRRPVHPVRSHGDYWARNTLLLRRGGAARVSGVVDWEQSSAGAPPFDDLFHFAVTYGLAYPWARYRRARPVDAFRRTFVDRTRVSRAVHRALHAYCAERRLDASLLLPFFRCFLLSRAARDGAKGGLWTRFEETIGAAGRSVFSG